MSCTQYESDVQDYLTKMETLNIRICLCGIPWQKALKTGLPAWFRDKMALGNKKRDFDDDEYIELIRATGIAYEEREQEKKDERETLRLLTEKSAAKGKEKSNPEKSKNDGGQKLKQQSDRRTTTQPKAESSSKKDDATTHSDLSSALKGIPETLREARKKRDLCLHCGKQGHRWNVCRGQVVITSVHKRKEKRKAEEPAEKEGSK
jgi:hypothetical protein